MKKVMFLVACLLVVQLLIGVATTSAAPAAICHGPGCGGGGYHQGYWPGYWPSYWPGYWPSYYPQYYQYYWYSYANWWTPYQPVYNWWNYPYWHNYGPWWGGWGWPNP
jgi:hypothetical protein